MGDVVDLKPIRLEENHEFVADCCRFQEGILTEANMKRKYGFANDVWERLGDDATLLGAVEDEKIRRVRTGLQKRERAQGLITKAPAILDSIMSDTSASPRHRVDAIKQLDAFTGNPQEGAPLADRFVITINLGADHVEVYNKSISINADDGEPDDGRFVPQRSLPVADKRWDDSDVVAAPVAKKTIKTGVKSPIEPESVKAVEHKTPEQIALESMMKY
jgi:hypothetical protein